MNVLFLPPGYLPIPCVLGGAVETGIQDLIDENEINDSEINNIIISAYNEKAYNISKKYKKTKFIFIKNNFFDKFICYNIKIINRLLKLLNIKKTFSANPIFKYKVVKAAYKMNPDVILIKNKLEYVKPIKKKFGEKKIILQLHNDFLNTETPNGKNIFNMCDIVAANSKYILSRILEIKGIKNIKTFVSMNCTEISLFKKKLKEEEIKNLKKKFNICKNDKVILFTGRLVKEKGVYELIKAIKLIPNDISVKLLVVGSGWFGKNKNNVYIYKLKRLSRHMEDKIIFTGFIEYKDLYKINSLADIAVVPSIWEEPAGRVAVEAQASGLPLIISDSGGMPEYVDKNNTIIVKRDQEFVKNLSIKIYSTLKNETLMKKMSEYSYKNSLKFDKKRYYSDFLKMIYM